MQDDVFEPSNQLKLVADKTGESGELFYYIFDTVDCIIERYPKEKFELLQSVLDTDIIEGKVKTIIYLKGTLDKPICDKIIEDCVKQDCRTLKIITISNDSALALSLIHYPHLNDIKGWQDFIFYNIVPEDHTLYFYISADKIKMDFFWDDFSYFCQDRDIQPKSKIMFS